MKLFLTTAYLTCLFFIHSASAQLMATDVSLKITNNFTIQNSERNDWMIYADAENHLVYIDFEKINTNLNVVSVKNAMGQVVFKDDNLWQLPVNTIYEIDCKKFTSGDYTLELKSFTTSCSRTIHVK